MRPIVTDRVACGLSVCLSICQTSEPAKTAEPIRLGCRCDRPKESCVRWSPLVLRDVAMATNFWLSMGYNFGCMIASDTLIDSRGGFSGSTHSRD